MTGRLRVVVDDLSGPEVAALLSDHLDAMRAITPEDSVHAFDLARLRTPDVTFWSVWSGDDLAGCGALKELSPTSGEVKSMRTAPAYLRRGVAAAVLTEIVAAARARGYDELLLETGHGPPFDAAHALYARFGFVPCGPFADYVDDPFSRFFRLTLPGAGTQGSGSVGGSISGRSSGCAGSGVGMGVGSPLGTTSGSGKGSCGVEVIT